jgi:hypothetical protein
MLRPLSLNTLFVFAAAVVAVPSIASPTPVAPVAAVADQATAVTATPASVAANPLSAFPVGSVIRIISTSPLILQIVAPPTSAVPPASAPLPAASQAPIRVSYSPLAMMTDLSTSTASSMASAAMAAPAAVAVSNQAPEDFDAYTGIVIDGSALPGLMRSPAPAVFAQSDDGGQLYPDRRHVPTPDEVQDESVVRYYQSVEDAEAGVAGTDPMVVKAVAMVGYGRDSVTVSDMDAARIKALDAKLHFSRTWRMAFVMPAGE